MANKFVLIPKELYDGLLAQPKVDPDLKEQAPLMRARGELVRVQRSKRQGAAHRSAKNVLYQQQLRRYLRLRKQTKDRPLKVRLDNGAPVLIKPAAGDDVIEKPTKTEIPPFQAGSFEDDVFEQVPVGEEDITPEKYKQHAESFRTPTSSTPKARRASLRKAKQTAHEGELSRAINALYEHVRNDPQKFGLSSEGESILSTTHKKPIVGSSTLTSLEHIVRGTPGSPKGTSALRYRLASDPYYRQLMGTLQLGEGKKRTKKQHQPALKFRPSKWTK